MVSDMKLARSLTFFLIIFALAMPVTAAWANTADCQGMAGMSDKDSHNTDTDCKDSCKSQCAASSGYSMAPISQAVPWGVKRISHQSFYSETANATAPEFLNRPPKIFS